MKPKLDLYFPNTHDLKTLVIVDTSSYPTNFSVINPTIEITPPSFLQKNLVFHTNSFNIFNSNTLELSCGTCERVDLPDGIWEIKYSVAPAYDNYVERTFLRVDILKASMEELFMHTEITECNADIKDEKLDAINQIEVYIEGAIAAANKCNNILAMKLYRVAERMIKNLKSC